MNDIRIENTFMYDVISNSLNKIQNISSIDLGHSVVSDYIGNYINSDKGNIINYNLNNSFPFRYIDNTYNITV